MSTVKRIKSVAENIDLLLLTYIEQKFIEPIPVLLALLSILTLNMPSPCADLADNPSVSVRHAVATSRS